MDDITTRLRVLNHHAKKLAENESLHDLHRDAFTRCEALTWKAAEEIMQLRQELKDLRGERDEARREICAWAARHFKEYEEHVARERGWDCFKENT